MTPSREDVLAALAAGPRSPRRLLEELGAPRGEAGRLRAVLHELVREGAVERVAGRYRRRTESQFVEGVFEAAPASRARPRGGRTSRPGEAGHVATDDGRLHPVRRAGGARPGDRVLLRLDGRRAEVTGVVARAPEEIVGVLHADRFAVTVQPWRDEAAPRIAVGRTLPEGARKGDLVVVEPHRARTRSPRRAGRGGRRGRSEAPEWEGPTGRVVEVLGPPGHPEADFRAVVWRRRLPVAFPADVLAETEALNPALTRAERTAREDLSTLPFVTIDPANARDHDDAVAVEPTRGGVRLWVAIADVSRLVAEGSALDREALRRGNSVYFPDRAIPMLPHALSGDLCSLREHEERPALAVALEIGRNGAVRGRRFARCTIRSRARLTYEEAAAVMEPGAGAGTGPRDPGIRAQLEALADVARRLMERRFAAGSIDFDLPTAEIVLGDDGHPVDIVEAPRTVAHRAIEEAMLAANRAVAETLLAAEVPALYRVHDPPLPGDLAALEELLHGLGLLDRRRGGPLGPREIAQAVTRARGRPEERLVNLVTLRSLRQARYAAECRPHFALAFEHYLHFTSPIRRYADLVVHRALLDLLDGGREARTRAEARGVGLEAVAVRVSARERLAMEAERDAVGIKKCVFIARHLGRELPGTIEGVARHGVYVALDEMFVEGLVHSSRLPPGLALDLDGMALVARRGHARLGLGHRVRVRVAAVDAARGRIDFDWVGAEGERPGDRLEWAGDGETRGARSGRARRPGRAPGEPRKDEAGPAARGDRAGRQRGRGREPGGRKATTRRKRRPPRR